MRRGWFVLLISVLMACRTAVPASAGPVRAAEPPAAQTRVGFITAQLKRDPVYVTDQVPRSLPPGTAGRIKALVARLGVPTYVVVTLRPRPLDDDSRAPDELESLVPVLHDRLGKDGVYLVTDPSGALGEVQQFGGTRRIDVEHAYQAATAEMPYEAGLLRILGRFVEIALSGHARERALHPSPRPESATRRELDAYDRGNHRAAVKNTTALWIGAGLGGLIVLGLLTGRRIRRGRRRPAPGARPVRKDRKRPAARGGTR
ncbi:hypothetical protein F8568_007925 [Actinomadura sp. LD22]|uniref:TPM domain-containing protein n=1 Tax=Actinomadura physcomitrii TaxID=2650748 RepID=A0A6I4M5F8_9ACTN|nr:hypothetical protein [Actinomadura physcomitrii]MWA00300.1 hypothetical protein [Actinomadura physcomitrii]